MHPTAALASGLILAASVRATGEDTRWYRREAERGTLVRLRRGVYVERTAWDALDERGRMVQRMRAYAAVTLEPPIFSHQSAAVLHDLPQLSRPDRLHVVTAPSSGGRSEGDVRKHVLALTDADVVEVDGLLTVSASLAVALLAAELPFREAVVPADGLLRRDPRLSGELVVRTLPGARAYRKASRVLNFASPLSESAGESLSRALIHELGLPAPVLQHAFHDRRGLIGVVDFWWPEHRLIGEFDGRVKYGGAFGVPGDEALWREKKREDRLRATGPTVTRWTWETLTPARLLEHLTRAGLPRPAAGRADIRTPAARRDLSV
jgi:hypothetical protein